MKRTIISSILFFAVSAFTFTNCQKAAVIDEADVTRIISILASDEMEGRMIFTPGIEKASQFIQSEFEKIGLEYLDGLTSYNQQFNIYSISPGNVIISLDGKIIEASNFLTMSTAESLKWTDAADLNIISVGASDNLQSMYNDIRRQTGKNLVLVDPTHKDFFARIKASSLRGSRATEIDNENGTVMVMTTSKSFKNISVEIDNVVKAESLSNVTGKISGKRANEIILFGGHYDHLGVRGTEGDTIYNGANDNASGTTAVITLAKYFKESGLKPERTIVFVAFTAEESGGYGARYFSEQMDPDQIMAMFNIEMIGKGAKEGPNTAWITGFEKSTFGELLQQAVEGTEYTFYPDPYPTQDLFYRSDNATLAKLGVPAHTISTTQIDIDKDYHQASDEVSTLDMAHMTNTIKAIAKAAEGMISGEQTPTRVDPSGLK
jgi:Zn-dependent M28 family amino/carboxypeptidase